MKKALVYSTVAFLLAFFSCVFVGCENNDDNESVNGEIITNDSIYAIDKECLGEWQEGFIKYVNENESQSCYIVSSYNEDEEIRTTYLGQLDANNGDGYYLFTDKDGLLLELRGKYYTYIYDSFTDEGIWYVYNNGGILIRTTELGKTSLPTGSTRGVMDNLVDLRSWFNNGNLAFHQEWGELAQNIGIDLALKAMKIGGWEIQLLVEGLSSAEQAAMRTMLYDGCVPQIQTCEKDGKIAVLVNGVSNLTDKYVYLQYNQAKEEFEQVEKLGKEVYMAVAIRKDESYVTYSNCDNHTTYVKISSSQENITVSSPLKFEPGESYYLRPYLIEKTVLSHKYNTVRQRYVQYGDVYKFRYTEVEIKKTEKVFLKDYSQNQYAVRLKINARIENLDNVIYWGVSLYDKNNEHLKELQCFSDNGIMDNDFQYDGYLDKSLFKDGSTTLKLVPYAKYDDGRYAYGETETYQLPIDGCPDANHPHWIDLGIGTQWRCCNAGASSPEEYGGYYTFDQAQAYNPPSLMQIKDLVNNCSYTWTTQNGVEGGKFTGPNGGTIFLPAAGNRWDGEFYIVGSLGSCWSSTPYDEDYAYGLSFGSGSAYWDDNVRGRGLSVRPVR